MAKTIVYVDGFNLYYRLLKGSPHKWLDLLALSQRILPRTDDIIAVNYYTARVSSRINPSSPRDQQKYLSALKSLGCVHIHLGSFQVHTAWMFLHQPLSFRPAKPYKISPIPKFAEVVKTEEKGSDVNLGCHLVRDAFLGKFERAAVITNDTDLAEPIRVVTQEARLPVTLIAPVNKPAGGLQKVSTNVRRIRPADLTHSQMPSHIVLPEGRTIDKPTSW